MRDPLAPWNRMLHRLDGVHAASQGRTFRPSLFPTSPSPPAPPCRSRPVTTNDPLAKLSLELASEIVCYLNPADVVVLQRVSKQWRVVLASEYIYTLALRAHFPGCEETRRVWELHEGGREMYPEEAVDGYRSAARRWCEGRRRGQIDGEEAHRGMGEDGEKGGEGKEDGRREEKSQDEQVARAMKNVSFIEEPDSDSDDATVIDSPPPSPPPSTAPKSDEDKENLRTTPAPSSSPSDPEKRRLRATEENALNCSPRCSPKDPAAVQELEEKAMLKDTALKPTKTVG